MICPLCEQPAGAGHDCETVAIPCPDGREGCAVSHVVYRSPVAAMAGTLPDHESIERYCRELPTITIARLPDSADKEEAKRLIDALADVAHRAREQRRPTQPQGETP